MVFRLLVVLAAALVAPVWGAKEMVENHSGQCPSCEDLFSKLTAGPDGRLSQSVEIQERGEPKSGTGMMGIWARTALQNTCSFLSSTYGKDTCHITRDGNGTYLLFEPQLSHHYGPCPCDTIDRVSIFLELGKKHELPVDTSCPWWHTNSIEHRPDACRKKDGTPLQNFLDLWSCITEAACKLTDSRLQFVPLRDPRATTVSAYFHRKKHHPLAVRHTTVDEYVWRNLAVTCQWVALRHIVFEGLLANASGVFWFEDAMVDPVGWHLRWTRFAGLQLPVTQVGRMAKAIETSFQRPIDVHVGGKQASARRTWKDEVGAEVLESADDILRLWLPPVLLARLDVAGR